MATKNPYEPVKKKAVVVFTARDQVHAGFVASLIGLYLSPFGRETFRAPIWLQTGPNLALARSWVTQRFLDSDARWCLMVDTDMTFTPSDVAHLMAAADADERPIVTGLYCNTDGALEVGYRDTSGSHEVTTWVWSIDELLGVSSAFGNEGDSTRLAEVDVCGAGLLLVHRRVFESFTDWFAPPPGTDENEGEDMAFCRRAKAAGFRIYAALDVHAGHLKTRELLVSGLPDLQRDVIAASWSGLADDQVREAG